MQSDAHPRHALNLLRARLDAAWDQLPPPPDSTRWPPSPPSHFSLSLSGGLPCRRFFGPSFSLSPDATLGQCFHREVP